MEANYIKSTVAPVLTDALTSLMLHKPYTQASVFDTSIDPITYIAQYLLNHGQKSKERATQEEEYERIQLLKRNAKESESRLKKARQDLDAGLAGRLSQRKSMVEKQILEKVVTPEVKVVGEVAAEIKSLETDLEEQDEEEE